MSSDELKTDNKFISHKLLNIGFGSFIPHTRVVAIIGPDSAPVKRLKDFARKKGTLVDATFGRKTRSIIITDSNHVVLSALQPETNAHRFEISGSGQSDRQNSEDPIGLDPDENLD